MFGQPVAQRRDSGSGRGEGPGVLRALAPPRTWDPHGGHHRVAVHIQPGAAVHQHVHPRLLPIGVYSRAAAPGRACQIKSLRFALAAAGQGASGLHAILLCELTAPSVTGVGPEATARRFSSGRVGRGHSYSYEVTTPRPVSAHEPRSGRTIDPHSRPENQSHDGSEPPLRGSPTSSLSHDLTGLSAPTRSQGVSEGCGVGAIRQFSGEDAACPNRQTRAREHVPQSPPADVRHRARAYG